MGYYSRLEGNLRFDPEISEALAETLNETLNGLPFGGYFEEDGWHDGGDTGKQYYFHEECVELFHRMRDEGVDISGFIVRVGEEQPDLERALFAPGQTPEFQEAKTVWPDGTEYRR